MWCCSGHTAALALKLALPLVRLLSIASPSPLNAAIHRPGRPERFTRRTQQ